jgi:hypothetical protein
VPKALMERHLPQHQFEEHHSLVIHSAPGKALDAAQTVALEPDPFIQRFIAVREFPARLMNRLGRPSPLPSRPFGGEDFTLLGRDADRELAFGLAGHFWRSNYGLQTLGDAAAFDRLTHLPKLVLNFSVEPLADGTHRLSTTTRVWCPDAASLRRFAPYWYLIRPVSGLIRQRLLQRIAAHAAQPVDRARAT